MFWNRLGSFIYSCIPNNPDLLTSSCAVVFALLTKSYWQSGELLGPTSDLISESYTLALSAVGLVTLMTSCDPEM